MRDIHSWPRKAVLLALIQRRGGNALLALFQAGLLLTAVVVLLALADSTASLAAESAATSTPEGTATTGATDAYLAQLRTVLPQSWLQREFQRQRSFPAFARSRQLVSKGQ